VALPNHSTTNASRLVTSCTAIQIRKRRKLRRTRSGRSAASKARGIFPHARAHDQPARSAAPARSPATKLQ
jgi:hypothetical protein